MNENFYTAQLELALEHTEGMVIGDKYSFTKQQLQSFFRAAFDAGMSFEQYINNDK